MLLPLGTRLADGVLHMLAERQGTRARPRDRGGTRQDPHALAPSGRGRRYDCVGSTALYVTLLGEARRWGLADTEIEPLLPHSDRALSHLATVMDATRTTFSASASTGPPPATSRARRTRRPRTRRRCCV